MQFRKDINGLRAIAVIAVVLFHFNDSWMPGGFAGVDVFFVISGFLMTGIIFRGLEQKNFSIWTFYIARANRIIPALAVLCSVVLILGWFYLNPIDYKTLSIHAASSITFLSNIFYWRESSYFDAISHEKWLLHTWSLSVEWQFYIIYPLVLFVLNKYITNLWLKRCVLLGAALSFILCVVATYKWSTPAYYLLPTRAWEMMVGGVAYLYPLAVKNKYKKSIEWLGLILIFLSYFLISKENAWPGYLALIPVLGVYLIIQSNRNESFILNNIVLQKIGTWSYSIYLWHWPLVVVIYFYGLSSGLIYFGIVLSVFLGFISNKYVEGFRFDSDINSVVKLFKYKPFCMVSLIVFTSFCVFFSSGAMFRFNNDYEQKVINVQTAIDDWAYPLKGNLKVGNSELRYIEGSSDKNILFIGASHIEHTYPYVKSLASKYNVYYLTMAGCLVTESYVHPSWSCSNIQNYKDIMQSIKFEKIVTSFYLFPERLSSDIKFQDEELKLRGIEYDDFLNYAKKYSNEVFLILGEPVGEGFNPKLSLRHNLKSYITLEKAQSKYTIHRKALAKLNSLSDIVIIDPIDYLCTDICKVMDDNNIYFYKDSTHFRPWYAKTSLQYLDVVFK